MAVGCLGIGSIGFLAMRGLGWMGKQLAGSPPQTAPLDISIDTAVIDIPDPPPPAEAIGVKDVAARAINDWLAAKRAALGPDYDDSQLPSVLGEPLLAQWQRRADAAASENWYWRYEHQVNVISVEPEEPTADELQAIAEVTEEARFFRLGVEDVENSYSADLTMRYDLVRQNEDWLVQDATQIEPE